MSAVSMPDELLESKEAAEFMKISVSWLAKARMGKEGPPFIQIGRSIRYGKVALIRWLKSHER